MRGEKGGQGIQKPFLHEVLDLFVVASRDGVGDSPGDLLPDLKLTLLHQIKEDRAETTDQHGLDLLRSSSSDVGDSPAALLQHVAFGDFFHDVADGTQGPNVKSVLGLLSRSGDDVTNSTKSGGDNRIASRSHQLNKTRDQSGLDNSVNSRVLSVGDVRDGPAGITQDFVVLKMEEAVQGFQTALNQLEFRGGLTTDQIGQGPGTITKEGLVPADLQVLDERGHGSTAQHKVSGLARVSSNISESPGSLFFVLPTGSFFGHFDKGGDGTGCEDDLGVGTGSRGNVGQSPGGFEFNIIVSTTQQLHETGNHITVNHLIDRGSRSTRQHLSQRAGALQAHVLVILENHLNQTGQVSIRGSGREVGIFGGGCLSLDVDVSSLEGKFLTFVLADFGILFNTSVSRFSGIEALLETSSPFILSRSSSSVHDVCLN
mmetsp:Transcript_30025/g.46499  ORF Transcript_30025/g.46499 Transcript_30025/m.46499 type:complete len:430 (-) Transcript_30025:33-1322(-)